MKGLLKKKYYSMSEVSEIVGLDKRTIISHNLVKLTKIGERYYVDRHDLIEFLGRSFEKDLRAFDKARQTS